MSKLSRLVFVGLSMVVQQSVYALNSTHNGSNSTAKYCEQESDCSSGCCKENACCYKEPVSLVVAIMFVLLLCFGCFILIGVVVAILHFMAQKKKKDIKRQSNQTIAYDSSAEPNILILPSELTIVGNRKDVNSPRSLSELNALFNNQSESEAPDLDSSLNPKFVKQVNFPADVKKTNVNN